MSSPRYNVRQLRWDTLDTEEEIKGVLKKERGYLSLSESGYSKRLGHEKESLHRYQENIKFLDSEIALLESKRKELAENAHDLHVLKLKEELMETLRQGEKSVKCFQELITEERRKKNRLHREKTKKLKKVEWLKRQVAMLQDSKIPSDLSTEDEETDSLRKEAEKISRENAQKIKVQRKKLQAELDVTTKLKTKIQRLTSQVDSLEAKLASCRETVDEKRVLKANLLKEQKLTKEQGEKELAALKAETIALNTALSQYEKDLPVLAGRERELVQLVSKEKAKITRLQKSIGSIQVELSLNYNQSVAALRQEIADMRELWVNTLHTTLSQSPFSSDDDDDEAHRWPGVGMEMDTEVVDVESADSGCEKKDSPFSQPKFPTDDITPLYTPKRSKRSSRQRAKGDRPQLNTLREVDEEGEDDVVGEATNAVPSVLSESSTTGFFSCNLIALTGFMYILALAIMAYQAEAFSSF